MHASQTIYYAIPNSTSPRHMKYLVSKLVYVFFLSDCHNLLLFYKSILLDTDITNCTRQHLFSKIFRLWHLIRILIFVLVLYAVAQGSNMVYISLCPHIYFILFEDS